MNLRWVVGKGFLSKVYAAYKVVANDAEIGYGEHAITTDESGKFWGSAGAGAVFYAKKTKKFLLAYRSSRVNEPHTWGVWGGALEDRERPKDAVKREVEEETGYQGEYTIIPSFMFQKGSFKYHNFIIVIDDEFSPNLDWETEKFGWFGVDEFPSSLHFGLKSLYPYLKKFAGKLEAKAAVTDFETAYQLGQEAGVAQREKNLAKVKSVQEQLRELRLSSDKRFSLLEEYEKGFDEGYGS
jgi:8-oxo-dGTP pyrophosphatase MutT (NUDIX family)